MAITNPTKYVTVRRLERFKQKILAVIPAANVATVSEATAAAEELT